MPLESRNDVQDMIRFTLAADSACDMGAFSGPGITVTEFQEMQGRRRFDVPRKPYQVISMGEGFVISCHADWLAWSRAWMETTDRDQVLAPDTIAPLVSLLAGSEHVLLGPVTSYACSADRLRSAPVPSGVTLELVEPPSIGPLQRLGLFTNALGLRAPTQRPDVLAVIARQGDQLVGCAGASADSDCLWQVGVDVGVRHRGRGIGSAMVGRLTEAIVDAGKVPYYSVNPSNLPSASLAISLGYWPAWIQMYALERQ